jgi:hypothetical protein
VITPADAAARPMAPPPDVQGRPSARRSAGALPYQPSVNGRGRLAEAVRTIDEGAAILAAARSDRVGRRRRG